MTKKYRHISPAFEDDILQVGRIALLEAIREYSTKTAPLVKPSSKKRITFSTFAGRKIQWAVYVFLHGRGSTYKGGFDSPNSKRTYDIDEPVGASDDGDPLTHRDIVDRNVAKDEESAGHDKENRLKMLAELRAALANTLLTNSERAVLKNYLVSGDHRMRKNQILADVVHKLRAHLARSATSQ